MARPKEENIPDLITYIQRRFLPEKVAQDLYQYLGDHLKKSSVEPDLKDTLVKIMQGLAWKANYESTGGGESHKMAEALWVDKNPEALEEGFHRGPPLKTSKQLREETLTSIRDAVQKKDGAKVPTTPVYSYMSTHFKKAPHIKAFLTPRRWATVQNVFRLVGQNPEPFPDNIFELRDLITRLEKVTETHKVKEWETRIRNHKRKDPYKHGTLLDKKDTYTAVYERLSSKERESLHRNLRKNDNYEEAVEIMGILKGRYRNYYSSGVRCLCSRLDKIGFVQFNVTEEELQKDLPTAIFLCMIVAEFSVRKEFTLDPQQQGALLPFLEWYMEDILKESPTTRWDLVAQVYPTDWILAADKCQREVVQKLYDDWLLAVDIMMPFILDQWANGVETRVAEDMAVCSSYTSENIPMDSEGWNIVIGAWNNAVRQIRMLAGKLDVDPPEIFKCMKLTAHDQMMWAEAEGKGVHVDLEVFKTLVKEGIMPWDGLQRTGVRDQVAAVCERHGARFTAWFGKPRERTGIEKSHGDMICGIQVTTDKPTADALKKAGLFKAKPSHVQKEEKPEDQTLEQFGSSRLESSRVEASESSHKNSDDVVNMEDDEGEKEQKDNLTTSREEPMSVLPESTASGSTVALETGAELSSAVHLMSHISADEGREDERGEAAKRQHLDKPRTRARRTDDSTFSK